MMITRLEPVNGRKYRVYLNDAPAFLLYSGEVSQYRLRENQELDEHTEKEIYSAVLPKRAKLRCMNLLKTMDKTEEQLRQKLRQGEYPEPVIEEALEYVKRYHYVDDFRYARNYIDSRKDTKSRQQICCDLAGRGVAAEVIRQAWEETETVDEAALILRWAEKKHFDPACADPKETQRFYQFLLRKGFSYPDIKKALT
ncbi:MAG: regulatory protein RecX [Lachnospiraceae bacterium]|nr:regulatory protein RecX [Lachnospiraceae bacterium]